MEIKLNSTPQAPPKSKWKFEESKWQNWNDDITTQLKNNNPSTRDPEAAYNTFYSSLMISSNKHFAPKNSDSPRESKVDVGVQSCSKECKKSIQNMALYPTARRQVKPEQNGSNQEKDNIGSQEQCMGETPRYDGRRQLIKILEILQGHDEREERVHERSPQESKR
jgi:hypothetical protein